MEIGIIASILWVIFIIAGLIGLFMFFVGITELDWPVAVFSIILMTPGLFLLWNAHSMKHEMKNIYSYNIYALEDNLSIQGRRYYIEQSSKYYYLADYKDGKKTYSVSTDNAYIVEDKGATPHIDVYEDTYIGISKFQQYFHGTIAGGREYKIVVPQKTLTNEFNVDLKN